MNTKPLLNLGEVMPEGVLSADNIPDLSGRTRYVGQTKESSLIAPTKITQAHQLVFVLAKAAKVMHRDDIANRAQIPIASAGPVLAKLKAERVLISPSWGEYALAKDFLRQFQYAYGTAKTETLFKVMEEGGIHVATFGFPLNDGAAAPSKPSMLDAIKEYLDDLRKRMAAITLEIGRLTEEKNTIATELASIGELTAPQPEDQVKEAA